MTIELNALEARVIGCLIEKQVATPDQYPLSLNALTNACNQKSNRDPVLRVDEREVQATVDWLIRRQLVMEKSGFGSRVPKYQHLFCNTQFGSLRFSPRGTAIVCELLLRGPQTPGELRTHAARLAPFGDVSEVEAELEELMTRPDGPYIAKLQRQPGRLEAAAARRSAAAKCATRRKNLGGTRVAITTHDHAHRHEPTAATRLPSAGTDSRFLGPTPR